MTIYSEDRRHGRELFGRFDFGEYEGVLRFCNKTEAQVHRHKCHANDMDEYLLDAGEMPFTCVQPDITAGVESPLEKS